MADDRIDCSDEELAALVTAYNIRIEDLEWTTLGANNWPLNDGGDITAAQAEMVILDIESSDIYHGDDVNTGRVLLQS